jgi:hypothetical protein
MKDIEFCEKYNSIYVDGITMGDDNAEIKFSFCDRHKSMQNHIVGYNEGGFCSMSVCLRCSQEIALAVYNKLEMINDSSELRIKDDPKGWEELLEDTKGRKNA